MDGTLNGNKKRKIARRVLVSGGAGFLGAHLCARLVEDGCHVVALDNLATGSIDNLTPLLGHPHFRFVRHDIVDPLDARAGLQAERIFNLACCASPAQYQIDPVKTLRTCVDGALNMLKLAQACGARIFQASTSEVYGEPEQHPQKEGYRGAVSTVGPRACYDEGKRCAETLFFDYHRLHSTDIKVARIFNTYGPMMQLDDGRVVSNLIVQALRNEPMTIHGDGSQTRSFCYVDDLIEGIVRLMDAPAEFTGPVNLGNPTEVTVLELARRIIDITGSRSRLVHRPMPTDDPTRRCPDIALARRALDWEPRVSLDEGLRRTVAWFERRLMSGTLMSGAPVRELEVGRGAA
ncbi:UDP-glucuronic acid decarboxylase family protein [Vulcaniibacterium tengchongense]|uniref:UDP-glucuronate decarboxylase n=1 Tax=Vulcaniibacterium tengchongense TaxID=1273429 RepID=A0A3N4VDP0_9GAMM|nr:UDP-glucuronic acid decarboxylase family protein [Vulcaniibacterium tengchongense]RPE81126.1 UDP-glucuronate decarboxylase [Vulcaniibacterium tengchongense]